MLAEALLRLMLVMFLLWLVFFKPKIVQKYHLVVNLVRQHTVEELVARLKAGKIISKEQVLRESKLSPVAAHGLESC